MPQTDSEQLNHSQPGNPPRPLHALLLYIATVCIVGSILAPVIYWLFMIASASGPLHIWHDTPFRRIANRSYLLVALCALYPLLKSLEFKDRQSCGYGLARRRFIGRCVEGFMYGVLMMALLVVVELQLGAIQWLPERTVDDLWRAFLSGAISGIAIGLVEETFFRGIFYEAIRQRRGAIRAILITSLVYSAVHFIHSRGEYPRVCWYSGFEVLLVAIRGCFGINNLGPFCALFAAGVLLALIREHSGHIGWTIGIHAGWVAVIKSGRRVTETNPESPYVWLVTGYDRITGYLAFAYLVVVIVGYMIWRHRRSREPQSMPSPKGVSAETT